MHLIETNDLKTWAGSKLAESRFPHLIKSLICAVIKPDKLRIPSGAAVWVPGFDGVVFNGEQNRFVPMGLSVWEVGTNSDYKSKAAKDLNKRSRDEINDGEAKSALKLFDRSEATFVFATPHVWKDKEKFIAKHKERPLWKDIVVLDGVDIQDWLEAAPAVNLEFAAELGRVPEEGIQTLEQAWEDWSYYTDPPLSEEIVTVGRGEQEKELIGRLTGPPSTFVVRGDSPHEAWGFVLAVIRRIDSENDRLALYARTIVVDSDEVAVRLRNLKNLIIIIKQVHGQVSGSLSSRGFHVVLPEGNDTHSERNIIKLARPTHGEFRDALVRMSLLENEAERVARECGLSVTILQRQRAHANYRKPTWAEGTLAVNLLPALLAGRWNDRNEFDREILLRLSNFPTYDQVYDQFRGYLDVDEPPLQKVAEMWTLTAPADAFQLLGRRLTAAHLERFRDAFRDVFGKIDPKVEIPPDEWLYYEAKGGHAHSSWLRSGMAETLLLIAERGQGAKIDCGLHLREYVDGVVRGLPGLNDDWRVLASIRDEYARLMEAAPDPLLYSLEFLLEANPEGIRQLFAEGEGIFGGGAMHTGLLWGLEILAWGPEFLPRVATILAKLASLDPGGRIGNRPIHSLREILLWWNPGTNASVGERLSAIDLVLSREPDVGWTLLAGLLPNSSPSISSMTSKPRWLDFGDSSEDSHTRRGQAQYVEGILDRALDLLGANGERWETVLRALRVVTVAQQDKIVNLLRVVSQSPAPEDIKTALWQKLRDFIYEHKTFHDANWALPEHLINQLELVLSALAPNDLVERHRWLFDDWVPELPSGEYDAKQRRKEVGQLRQEAAEEIMSAQGIEGLVKLGATCKLPGFVASSAVPLMQNIQMVRNFVDQAVSAGEPGIYLASQISGQALQLYKDEWRALVRQEARVGTWPSSVVAALLVLWPDEKPTWEEARALGKEVEFEYWQNKTVHLIEGAPDDQAYQILWLVKVGRADQAFHVVAMRAKGIPNDVLLQLFDATFDKLTMLQIPEEVQRIRISSHDVSRVLDELRNHPEISRVEVARREYRALPLLRSSDTHGLTIHELMAEDPGFFVEVLCEVFLPANRDKSEHKEPTAEEQARWRAAYGLLESMQRIPGLSGEDQIDESTLLGWIEGVREKAAEQDRSKVADHQIGDILAHSPQDPIDKAWPHRAIRKVIENHGSIDLEHGLMIERRNMRGVVSKGVYEGGDQERTLASQYRIWSKTVMAEWPRVGRMLESIATGWEEQARREDEEAEQRKLE